MSIQDAVEAAALRATLGLPERVQKALAGKPVVLDGQTLAPETQLMLRLQRVARLPGAETMPIPQGRVVIAHQSAMSGRSSAQPIGGVRDLDLDGVPGRLYTPRGAAARTPLLVFFHGGGFMYGDLDSHDATCRVLAEGAGVRVLAVDYRLAPEAPFPAAYDDALAAYLWAVEHAETIGADPARLAVGGDSAGGNLAAAVANEAARRGLPLAFQLLVYPATDNAGRDDRRSFQMFGEGFFLTRRFMELATESYLPDVSQRDDPRASPLADELPAGLAPAYVVTAGFDPLRDEGEAYAEALEKAGVAVELRRFPDQIHGFFNIVGVGRRSRAAVDEIAVALRKGLGV